MKAEVFPGLKLAQTFRMFPAAWTLQILTCSNDYNPNDFGCFYTKSLFRWPLHCCTECPSWRSLQGMEIPSEGPVTTNELYLQKRCDTTRTKFNMSIAKCCQWSEPQFQPTRYVVVLVVDTEASADERPNQFGYCWTAGSENHTCSM